MRTSCCAAVFAITVAGIVLPTSPATAAAPEGVSPGGVDRALAIEGRCPSFSWGAVDDAAFYEVVAYRLPEGVDLAALADVDLSVGENVLYTQVAGKATAWTPELERCFIPGNSYIWFVRAVFGEDGTAAATDWSQGLFFSVAAAPSTHEVRRAIGVLQRYLEEGGGGSEQLAALLSNEAANADPGAARRSPSAGTSKLAGRALPGTAAIRGEQADPTGETYGVYGVTNSSTGGSFGLAGEATAATGEVFGVGGITASADGAGVVAFNAAGGTDLILGADEYSAHLTELGLSRSVPGPATFDVTNSDGAGGMTLRVDGVDVVTTATDRDALGGLSCASGEVTKWNGSRWACDDDLDTDTTYSASPPISMSGTSIGLDSSPCSNGGGWFWSPAGWVCELVTGDNIADGSVSGVDISDRSITGTDIQQGAVGSSEIKDRAVWGIHIQDRSITGTDIQQGAIGSFEIEDGAVWGVDIHDSSVTGADIQGEAITSAHILNGTIGGGDIAPEAIGVENLRGGSVTREKINGVEKECYEVAPYCGGSGLTLDYQCWTVVCNPGPPAVYFDCDGACNNNSGVPCPNTLVGYLLSPAGR